MVRHFLSPVVSKAVVVASVVGCALLVLPERAQSQEPAAGGQGFGAQGQIAVSGELGAGFDKVSHGGWTAAIKPAGDYFILPSVTAGGFFGFTVGNASYQELLVGGRAGFNLNATPNLGAWPKVGVAYDHAKNPARNPMTTSASTSSSYLTVDAPILYHIVPHLFVGLGPYYYLKLSGDGNTAYGVHSLVGGWF